MNIGLKIKEIRLSKGISQDELATAICKSKSSLQKYENGEVSITIDVLLEIASALNINIIQLLSNNSDDILDLVIAKYGFNNISKQEFSYDFNLFMEVLKLKYN